MGSINVAQLKKQIEDSPLLTQAERAEWLNSLEFMNDKQMEDLFLVLSSPEQPKVEEPSIAPATPKPATQFKPEPTLAPKTINVVKSATVPSNVTTKAQGVALENFLHRAQNQQIFSAQNLPGISDGPVEVKQLQQQKPLQVKQNVPVRKKISPEEQLWRDNLERQVKEKELPEGEAELLLPQGEDVVPVAPKPVKTLTDSLSMSVLLDATKPSLESKDEEQNNEVEHITEPQMESARFEGTSVKEINSLSDVSKISVASLGSFGQTELFSKLKDLIVSQGYFEVLFNLEKSPLYLAYIATGKKILKDHVSFESLENDQSSLERFLTKDQFEQTADLLRSIKGS